MWNKLLNMTIEEIKKGYTFDDESSTYTCNLCGRVFHTSEVYKVADRYYLAEKMIKTHLADHTNMFEHLTSWNKKHTGLTENQKELLKMVYTGMNDQEIAQKTGIAASTVRHQKFSFREKAKQAKLYLAIYELVFEGTDREKGIAVEGTTTDEEGWMDIHDHARMVDDRYQITKAEETKILSSMFTSLTPLKLKTFATKEKNKVVILKKISEQFEMNKRYTEKELNSILKDIYADNVTIRRYLIEYGFMDRKKDCSEYWLL